MPGCCCCIIPPGGGIIPGIMPCCCIGCCIGCCIMPGGCIIGMPGCIIPGDCIMPGCCMGGIMPGDCIGMPAGGAGGIIGCAAGCMGDAKLIGLALAEGGAGAPIAPPMGCGAVENPSRPANAL